ncbi:site-specific DNA-methyltransferase [Micrococcus porci]|uniref:site-specific DNA-methyltransferase n=1 Tax=Micrococcus porci TaxID=2856555 RepID=UPI003CE8D8D6
MKRKPTGRLELNWMGKDSALIPSEDGKYDYAWVDPEDVRVREVKPLEVLETVGDMNAEGAGDNLVVIGDSGDALRSLASIPEWKAKYEGQVKLVYIDPPFNTEQTFEHYADQLEHSVWLTMMRDRIRDMKPLLAKDASVWVHLDDAEVHRMRVLMDEEFGAENFVATICWQRRASRSNDAGFSVAHDLILVYATNAGRFSKTRNRLLRDANAAGYGNPDNDPRGLWQSVSFNAPGARGESLSYGIEGPTGRVHYPPEGRHWSCKKEDFDSLVQDSRIWFGANGDGVPRQKVFLTDDSGLVPNTWWTAKEVGTNDTGKKEIQALFPGQAPFSTPKPERLLERIIQIGSNSGDLGRVS